MSIEGTRDFLYYMHDGSTAFSFELAGRLSDEGVRELQQTWRTGSSMIGERSLIVDLSYVTGVDAAGQIRAGEGAAPVDHRPGRGGALRNGAARDMAPVSAGGSLGVGFVSGLRGDAGLSSAGLAMAVLGLLLSSSRGRGSSAIDGRPRSGNERLGIQ